MPIGVEVFVFNITIDVDGGMFCGNDKLFLSRSAADASLVVWIGGGAFIEKVGEGLLERGGTESCVLGSFRDLSFCYLGASIALATLFILDAMFLPLSRLSPALSKSIDPLALLYLCSHPYVADLNIEE